LVANVEATKEQPAQQIAAVQEKKSKKKYSRPVGKKSGASSSATAGKQVSRSLTQACRQVGSGLCYSHWTFGAKADRCEAPCSWAGNKSPWRLNAVAPGFLVHILDQISGRRILLDTSAAFSILPYSSN
jgi:hypothetical protein